MGFCKLHKFKILKNIPVIILGCEKCNLTISVFGDHITLTDYDDKPVRKHIYFKGEAK